MPGFSRRVEGAAPRLQAGRENDGDWDVLQCSHCAILVLVIIALLYQEGASQIVPFAQSQLPNLEGRRLEHCHRQPDHKHAVQYREVLLHLDDPDHWGCQREP